MKNPQKIEELLVTINTKKNVISSANDLKGIPEYENLKLQKNNFLKSFILDLIEYIEVNRRKNITDTSQKDEFHFYYKYSRAKYIIAGLLRKNLKYNEKEWIELVSKIQNSIENIQNDYYERDFTFLFFPMILIINQLEKHLKSNDASEDLKLFIYETSISKYLQIEENTNYGKSAVDKVVKKLNSILQSEAKSANSVLKYKDIGKYLQKIIQGKDSEALQKTFILADKATGNKPTKKFLSEVDINLEIIDREQYKRIIHQLLNHIIAMPLGIYTKKDSKMQEVLDYYFLTDESKQFIKGIVWSLTSFSDKETTLILSKLLEKSYEKIWGYKPCAIIVANACAYTLANMRGKLGLGELSRLRQILKHKSIKNTLDKHLYEGAKRYKISIEELKETTIPDFKLIDGQKTISFNDYTLTIFINNNKIQQQWTKPDGKTMKSIPSVVKNTVSLTTKLKAVRKEISALRKAYQIQKQRIENMFIANRTIDYSNFKKRYFDHGLVSVISKKLIWVFEKETKQKTLIFLNGKWVNFEGKTSNWIDENCTVKLWHPITATEKEIVLWRDFILNKELKQPIKQVFREIYILTDAEQNTETYSNRMASHILKQGQFNALTKLRDWSFTQIGGFDNGAENLASKHLFEHGITAEYWVDGIEEENDFGFYNYLATDQIKFIDNNQKILRIEDVPKVVFSEIMRDIDLFVGVCSIGNDPEWNDNGERSAYWNTYSFGDLSEISKTRKMILERLLPKLKISKKAHISGKFLVVKGDLRTYKIHIGSGNILMEPHDQYLCIVPHIKLEKITENLFIPFDEDKVLSIILSKAFLLAEDSKIKDDTILSQIKK